MTTFGLHLLSPFQRRVESTELRVETAPTCHPLPRASPEDRHIHEGPQMDCPQNSPKVEHFSIGKRLHLLSFLRSCPHPSYGEGILQVHLAPRGRVRAGTLESLRKAPLLPKTQLPICALRGFSWTTPEIPLGFNMPRVHHGKEGWPRDRGGH